MRFSRISTDLSQTQSSPRRWRPPENNIRQPDKQSPHRPNQTEPHPLTARKPCPPHTTHLRWTRPHQQRPQQLPQQLPQQRPQERPQQRPQLGRATAIHKLAAALLAILIAMSLLVCMLTLLSDRLHAFASELDARHSQPPPFPQHHPRMPHRKLASLQPPATPATTWRRLTNAVTTSIRLINLLYAANGQLPAAFAWLLTQPFSSFTATDSRTNIALLQSNHHDIRRTIIHHILQGTVTVPSQFPQSGSRPLASSISPTTPNLHINAQPHLQKDVPLPQKAPPSYSLSSPHRSSARRYLSTKYPTSARAAQPRKVLHMNALTVVQNVGLALLPKSNHSSLHTTSEQTKVPNTPATAAPPRHVLLHPSLPLQKPSLPEQHPLPESTNTGNIPQAIQMWGLPGGKHVCRIFDVGRLRDGTFILPRWMKQHDATIEHRCGIRNFLFSLPSTPFPPSSQPRNNPPLDQYPAHAKLNTKNIDRDLFGIAAPRQHMPHFVSDIISPLLAIEVLMGSGRIDAVSSVIRPMTMSGLPKPDLSVLPELNPSILIQQETFQQPQSHWVARLAKFFQHPILGFTLIPTDEGKTSSLSDERSLEVAMYRSVIHSNVNPYEPYGLFSANGQNIVFSLNGISRDPAWTTMGMSQFPCRVFVTALTRRGPRGLLGLQTLETDIKRRFQREGIIAGFRVVDFGNMSFDDQVQTMQQTNVLITTHGAGNANFIFMRPAAAVIEVFPFAYKAGPFDGFANIFGLNYSTAMSIPQTDVFKECMNRNEKNQKIKRDVFEKWDKAVAEEKRSPWVHRLGFEKEFGDPGKSQGKITRGCARLQELEFNIAAVSQTALDSGKAQCAVPRNTQ